MLPKVNAFLGRIYPGLLVLLLCGVIGLVAAQPILVTGQLPQGHDALFHLQRLVQLDGLIHQGILYSRWAPDLARGLGYPLFNYYAPLSYYLPELLHLLGLAYTPALLVSLVALLIVAAMATYLWARDILGRQPALLAAAAYVLSPYYMVNLLTRTVLAELFALALVPLTFYSLHRLLKTARVRYAWILCLTFAGVILSHNVTAVLLLPFLLMYILLVGGLHGVGRKHPTAEVGRVDVGRHRLGGYRRAVRQTGLALLGALGLSAFFWLPALAEQSLVQMDRMTLWSLFDYRLNFLRLDQVFALPVLGDLHLVNRLVPHSLSLVAAGLAIIGLLGVCGALRKVACATQIAHLLFALLGLGLTVWMILPQSAQLWARIPPLHLLQFPWRWLGLATLFLAWLAGAGLGVVGRWSKHAHFVNKALCIGLPLLLYLFIFPWQYVPRFYSSAVCTSITDILQAEYQGPSIGTTTTGEYLPVTARQYPPSRPEPVGVRRERLDPASLPAGGQVLEARYTPLSYDLQLDSSQPFTAVLNTLDFAGWSAWLDGRAVPITPSDPYGLISVHMPAGRHRLLVRFASTPVRTWAEGIAWVSLAALLASMSLALLRRCRTDPTTTHESASIHARHPESLSEVGANIQLGMPTPATPAPQLAHADLPGDLTFLLGVMLVLGLAFGFKTRWLDPYWQSYQRTQYAIPAQANFANQLLFIGADRPPAVRSGEWATVVLYWRVPSRVTAEYSTSVQVVDQHGNLIAQADNQHPGAYPTTAWDVTNSARDPHEFQIPAGTPPGRYTVRVAVYPYGQPGHDLAVLDAAGAPQGQMIALMPLEVTRPLHPANANALGSTRLSDLRLGQGLVLAGYDLPQDPIRAGERLPLTLVWLAHESPMTDLTLQVQFLDARGQVTHTLSLPPVVGYATSQWQRGDTWRARQQILIPPRLAGPYTLTLGLAGETPVTLGSVEIVAPPHLWQRPNLAFPQEATFGSLVHLVGYDRTGTLRAGQPLTVTLVWRALQETASREDAAAYKTFVHLLGADGRVVVGSDAVPGDWQRPTSSWVEGEYILDPHVLPLPENLLAGDYRLEVGLYNSLTLQRLPLGDGSTALLLAPDLRVEP